MIRLSCKPVIGLNENGGWYIRVRRVTIWDRLRWELQKALRGGKDG